MKENGMFYFISRTAFLGRFIAFTVLARITAWNALLFSALRIVGMFFHDFPSLRVILGVSNTFRYRLLCIERYAYMVVKIKII